MSDDEVLEPIEIDEMGTITLMLGLYLILLAFFILLNTMAVVSEDKTKAVSESVAEGFGFRSAGAAQMRDNVAVTVNPVYEKAAQEINKTLESYVAIEDYRMVNFGSKMVLTLKTDEIFIPGQIFIKPAMAEMFDDVASLFTNEKMGTYMIADILVNNQDIDRLDETFSVLELAGRRATLFARALIERGVPEKRLSSGAVYRKPDYVEGSNVQVFFEVQVADEEKALNEAKKLMLEKAKEQQKAKPQGAPLEEKQPEGVQAEEGSVDG